MLVLSRRNMESVVVGAADRSERLMKVTVLDIRNGSVRLGFEAEANVAVHRSEVWERIVAETEPASAEMDRTTVPADDLPTSPSF